MKQLTKFDNIWFKIAAMTTSMTWQLVNYKNMEDGEPFEKYYINTPIQSILGVMERQVQGVLIELGRKMEEQNAE